MLGISGQDALFAFALTLAVHAQWGGGIRFLPGLATAAVKHVVGGIVHQPRAQLSGLGGQHAGGQSVEGVGQFGFALRPVYGGMGGGIDDDVRLQAAHGVFDAVQIGQIAAIVGAVAVECTQFAQCGQAALQLPADLAVFAQ